VESGFKLHVAGNAFVAGASGTITKTVVDTADQRLVLGSYFESGVGQHAFIASTNNAETGNSALLFQTGTTERLRIDASGNVGIGTGVPASKFAVSTGDNRKQFTVDVSSDPVVKIGLPDWYDTGSLAFVNGSGGERMRIDASGNVGIGTNSPSHPLHVAGDINTSEQYLVDGTQVVSNRATGWEAATGTATRTTFATSTVTTAQLAQRVKALIDDLTTHGLIGA
jgi:hypothetical protein